ncbi:hypothetical protein AD948_06225 [Acetobacter senegalensis]|uniref:Uncharacterized protein n=1 Tax=Acetobacter senegalensis TaxID=446692 RepID=A0A149U3S4_9PROT|nr:hypothetical protein AD948_06225 [Acetobacter senegalensis]
MPGLAPARQSLPGFTLARWLSLLLQARQCNGSRPRCIPSFPLKTQSWPGVGFFATAMWNAMKETPFMP